ncbi:heavy metal-binding protein HIP-like [Littorina saxatilis]|uniref:heavy metal-binding protein HIP-like n=1 Tax=Littorina saxatilis TaxID=31220 RepID=UPI0038B4C846
MWSPVVVLLLVALSGVAEGGVWKRSDDTSTSEVLLQQLSKQLNHVTAQVAALQAQLKAAARSVAFQARSVAFQARSGAFQARSVAFQAQPSSGLVQLGADATVVYDKVNLTIGNAYDDHTGFFTAPLSGTYTFSVSCMAGMQW